MRHAVIHGGVVVNVILIDEVSARAEGLIATEEASVGWFFDGEKFTPPKFDVDAEAKTQRESRAKLLGESDIAVYPDRWARMTPEQQTVWSNYRQALRDISMQDGFPLQINWPVKPE